jgi:hypothetical protein
MSEMTARGAWSRWTDRQAVDARGSTVFRMEKPGLGERSGAGSAFSER